MSFQILDTDSSIPEYIERITSKLVEVDPNVTADLNAYEIEPNPYISGMNYIRFKCKEKSSSKEYILKIQRQQYLDNPISSDDLINEVIILSKYKNPTIIGYNGFAFKSTNIDGGVGYRPILILEYTSNRTLQNCITKDSRLLKEQPNATPILNSTKKMIIMVGMAACLAYLHQNRIIHRNFNPSHVYLDDNFYPKVAGFETSIIVDENTPFDKLSLKPGESVGTSMYLPPEFIESDDELYSSAVDMFSFALSIYQLFSLKLPFNSNNSIHIISAIIINQRPNKNEIPNQKLADLIELGWNANPSSRPTFKDFLETVVPNKDYWPPDVDENEFVQYLQLIGIDPNTGKFVA